ncbi:MAG: hypothetical protein TECD_00575 [Hyphomicrobiaceae bacterium hypho_1]
MPRRRMEIVSWILFILLIAGVSTLGILLLRGYLEKDISTGMLTNGLFSSKLPNKRLDVVDQIAIDGRRRLFLVRRDSVEHLIMTGGPTDVVIETSITNKKNQTFEESVKTSQISQPVKATQNTEGEIVFGNSRSLDFSVNDTN